MAFSFPLVGRPKKQQKIRLLRRSAATSDRGADGSSGGGRTSFVSKKRKEAEPPVMRSARPFFAYFHQSRVKVNRTHPSGEREQKSSATGGFCSAQIIRTCHRDNEMRPDTFFAAVTSATDGRAGLSTGVFIWIRKPAIDSLRRSENAAGYSPCSSLERDRVFYFRAKCASCRWPNRWTRRTCAAGKRWPPNWAVRRQRHCPLCTVRWGRSRSECPRSCADSAIRTRSTCPDCWNRACRCFRPNSWTKVANPWMRMRVRWKPISDSRNGRAGVAACGLTAPIWFCVGCCCCCCRCWGYCCDCDSAHSFRPANCYSERNPFWRRCGGRQPLATPAPTAAARQLDATAPNWWSRKVATRRDGEKKSRTPHAVSIQRFSRRRWQFLQTPKATSDDTCWPNGRDHFGKPSLTHAHHSTSRETRRAAAKQFQNLAKLASTDPCEGERRARHICIRAAFFFFLVRWQQRSARETATRSNSQQVHQCTNAQSSTVGTCLELAGGWTRRANVGAPCPPSSQRRCGRQRGTRLSTRYKLPQPTNYSAPFYFLFI